uniref:hypothetical protein n=1 Tax=Providencia rustigianii TaxID=158850 RepID=UPI00224024B3
AYQPDRRLPMAQQCQGRCGEVQAIATAATGLACFIFRFLRRPLIDLSGDLHAALAERQEKSLQPQPVAESTPAPDIQDQLRAGMEAFRREFETRKEFMKGVETYKQEQERQREKERQERLRKELSRGHGNDRDQGYER